MGHSVMLIVDDVKINCEAIASSFLEEYEVAYAQDGQEAMEYVQHNGNKIDIILLDIMMPNINGIDFLKWLSNSEYADVPVLAITAESEYQMEAMQNGAWDFVVKPVDHTVLHMRVKNVLGRRNFLLEQKRNKELLLMNQNLEEVNRQREHLINSIPGGIAIYRVSDRFETLFFSDGVAELSGHTREEYEARIGDDAASILYEPDKDRLIEGALRDLMDGKQIDETYRIYHKNGNLVWVRLNALPMQKSEQGILVHAVFQDVSPQAKLYKQMLDRTQTAVYACDVNTYDILYFNQQMAQLTGVEETDARGKKCYELFFHKDKPCAYCQMEAMEHDTMLEREFSYEEGSASYQMKGTLLDWNGITAHVEYIQDITARKAREAENAALLEQLGSMMEHVPGAMCLYLATEEGLKPLKHNRSFYEIFGYSKENQESIDNKTDFLNVHPEDVEELNRKVQMAVAKSIPISHTYRQYNDKLNAYIWIYMQAVVTKQPDGSKLCYVSYTDITTERIIQKELHDAQENMELLQNQAKTALKEYQTLVNTVPGAIVVYEIVNEMVQIKYYSDGLCTLSGYKREERTQFDSQDARNRIDERDIVEVDKAIKKAIKNQSNFDLSFRIKTKDGGSRYVQLNATYVKNEDGNPQFHAVFSDIEELKHLEQVLREQQLRYEVAIKSSGINIWEYDIQSDCLTVVANSSRIKQNCYTIEHYIESTITHGYVREDCKPTFYSIFERLKQGVKEVSEDIWYKTTDEAGWWCERVIYTTVFDDKGVPQKAFGAGRDVTREKEAIQKFQDEMHYRVAIQGTELGSVKLNLSQNTILEGNSPFEEVDEWIKKGCADTYFRENAKHITNAATRADYKNRFSRSALIIRFNSGEFTESMNFTRVLKDNTICWMQYSLHLVKNPENNDIIAFIIAHDITDEQVVKMVMKTVTRTDYERLIVVDGSINSARDFAAVQKEQTFFAGDTYEERMQELVKKNVLKKDQERVAHTCTINQVMKHIGKGDIYKFNYSVVEEDGEVRRKQMQFTLIDAKRRTFLIARIDVNDVFVEQEQTKQELQQALVAAQSAAKAKMDFLSRMSHDIRTPLNAVIGFSKLGEESNSLEDMKEYYGQIGASGKYLLSIINDVLDMSKIESQRLVLKPKVVSTKEFVEDTLAIVIPMAQEKHIRIETLRQGDNCTWLKFDTTYVRQVIVNLLSNAIKFTPEGGLVEVIINNTVKDDKYVTNCLTIRDNGIGISKEFLTKLFDPFEQENTKTDVDRKGTGLGLSIVKSIVELMGGSVEVESEVGCGSTFTVHWDFEMAEKQDMPKQVVKVANQNEILCHSHILMCEDHPLNIQIAQKLLEKMQVEVTVAENGQEGLERFEAAPDGYFDAILMDIRMPVMDGITATKAIRSSEKVDAGTIPIIAMTANAFAEDVEQTSKAGMNAHLAKPIEPEVLYATLAKFISK